MLRAARDVVQEMRAGHAFLMTGDNSIAPPARASETLEQLYLAGGQRLERTVGRFLDTYEKYLEDPDANWAIINVERVNVENFLMVTLERAADLHAEVAEGKMDRAIELHRIWIAVALALVGFVVLFVFRPLARDAARAVGTISAELDDRAVLLSRSFTIAKLGHWRIADQTSSEVWLSKEVIDLLELDLEEGAHPLFVLQFDTQNGARDTATAALQDVWETGHRSIARSTYEKLNGDHLELVIHMDAEIDTSGNVVAVVGVITDRTSETAADQALIDSYEVIERKSHDLVEAQRLGKLGTWRHVIGTHRLEWDESAFELLGMDPTRFETSIDNVNRLFLEGDLGRVTQLTERAITTGQSQSDTVQAYRGDGSVVDLHIRFKLECDEHEKPLAVFGTLQDVSKQRAAARELEQLAYFDGLTGLANRTLFSRELNRVSKACAEIKHQAALLLIDLDHFKEVNDTLGHQAGDELLGVVGHRLAKVFSDIGFVARLGGDEFAVIVEHDISTAKIDSLCQDIITNISLPVSLSLGKVQTNASIGVALAPLHSVEPDELLSFADLALYSSKEQGRGRACYYTENFSTALETRISLGNKIRRAIDKKRFEVHYQPLVDIRTQTVCSFEALLRLPNGDGGYIPPSEFIAVAESSHLIADLGTFVLHKACEDAQSWVASGQPRRTVSVNVSPAQIWHGDLEQVIDSALNASGLSPDLLCLELTESVFVADSIERLNGILCRLHQRGIRLALDDFGTGYSSLGYLTRLPFDILKIDRMFVSKAHASAEKRKMLRGVVSLAKGLDLKVTAEGVETAEELNLVRDLGCDTIQGWYFSKALPNAQALVNAERIDTQRSMTIPDTPKNLYKGGSLS
ncbi:bifunctional diguanylate cyclase/phosphodiesterase [Roseobacter sp.]